MPLALALTLTLTPNPNLSLTLPLTSCEVLVAGAEGGERRVIAALGPGDYPLTLTLTLALATTLTRTLTRTRTLAATLILPLRLPLPRRLLRGDGAARGEEDTERLGGLHLAHRGHEGLTLTLALALTP